MEKNKDKQTKTLFLKLIKIKVTRGKKKYKNIQRAKKQFLRIKQFNSHTYT